METAINFIEFALSHAKKSSVPKGADLPIPVEEVGSLGEWVYLFGTTGNKVTKALLEERFKNYYSKKGWTREAYDELTKNWVGRTSTDCQGLPDSFLGTDVTANYNYVSWCTEKGAISEINRPFVIGEAVFFQNSEGRMTHVGFVCGFLDGEPLVVEARGIRYGVVITKFSERPWTHRGKSTAKLDFTKPIEEPVMFKIGDTGANVIALQTFLVGMGYPDQNGKALVIDGKLGAKTWHALTTFAGSHVEAAEGVDIEAAAVLNLDKADKYTICVFRTDDFPKEV